MRARSAGRAFLLVAVVALSAGCFKSLDIPKIPCDPAKANSCPSGYACTFVAGEGNFCRRPTDGGADVPAVASEAGVVESGSPGEAAGPRPHGPGIDGPDVLRGEAGGFRIDGALDSTADGVADVPIGGGEVGGPDLPWGTGGAGGGDGPVRPPVDSGADVPIVADGGTGGAGGIVGTGGTGGTGGAPGTGGATGTGGASGTGGAPATGGAAGTGGATGTGGAVGTGGVVGTGGAVGTGGTTAVCQEGTTECSGNGVRTCASGQWGAAVDCGAHQTCTGPAGTAQCTCNVDPVCTSVGGTCSSATVLADCAQDAEGCFYQSSVTTCTNGACYGPAGAAACCTNACTLGTSCLSGTTLETCAVGANGCTAANTSACASGLVCERLPPAECLDPTWAEWPMPNSQEDVTAGAPNLASYTDNGDGTVTDNVTGLMWQQAVAPGTYDWEGAKAYCPTLTLAGHGDWRLPTRIELVSLVDLGRSNPAIDTTYFPGTPSTEFWSSSPLAGSSLPSRAWYVSVIAGGLAGYADEFIPNDVRCVR
ncbi:MAG: DUF1566 domain-containing protein [Deltaproteobacteria bacterium]|nr:DUF1566 domain-containing protein [Deltaproteobacteria bacterium]